MEASNGTEALSITQELSCQQIDLVLTDVVMPQMGGRELVGHLQRMFPNIKALFVSGYTEDRVSYGDSLNPTIGFIAKPFMPNTLLTKVREVIDED